MDYPVLRQVGVALAFVVMVGSLVVLVGDERVYFTGVLIVVMLEAVSIGLLYFCSKE
jgi:hypothetical protein